MSDLDALEERIGAAMGRIKAAVDEARAAPKEDPAALRRAERINEALRNRLKEAERKREADVAQLDDLISQLRPLVEEGEHA
ncbi:putative membrane protein YccC [Rubricella aquisinus]|uniref:Putative membrane protein YccC n=1 Tax=Rubricella aquisinus TaxID=2028108 RepID=A0A840WNB2_9RHOB|nr:hypothetical protein [Rubricella aquisinus]MBB5516558.1 putative membrane protein YccC [Rubricella aquisinus]